MFFNEMIQKTYGDSILKEINDNINCELPTTLRINPLKGDVNDTVKCLEELGFSLKQVDFYSDAYLLLNKSQAELEETEIYQSGKIYLQSLSSMIPPLMLDLKANQDILDMAAAPGGKTTEMAAITYNKARITACELNQIRAKRLSYNISLQGASSVYVLNQDARHLDSFFSFDRILLDAPCSGSGTRRLPDSFKGLTKELVAKSVKSQQALIKKAISHLKPGGELVYSTCSIFKEENEEILKLILKDKRLKIVPIKIDSTYLQELPSTIPGTLTIMPNRFTEGFFIAKIRKD